jgi:co-chaperonin GroES (HSP10)
MKRGSRSAGDTSKSPGHSDGGWHGSAIGSEKFDTLWEPMFDRLLVKRIPDATRIGSIFVPDTAAKLGEQSRGVILRVGPGKRIDGEGNQRQALEVKPGDEIIFGRWTDWDSFGDDVVLIQEADIRVVLSAIATTRLTI